jgi:hypothetical protein
MYHAEVAHGKAETSRADDCEASAGAYKKSVIAALNRLRKAAAVVRTD